MGINEFICRQSLNTFGRSGENDLQNGIKIDAQIMKMRVLFWNHFTGARLLSIIPIYPTSWRESWSLFNIFCEWPCQLHGLMHACSNGSEYSEKLEWCESCYKQLSSSTWSFVFSISINFDAIFHHISWFVTIFK